MRKFVILDETRILITNKKGSDNMNNQFLDLIDRRIEQKLNAKQSMKREPAKIISVSSGYKKAVVKLLNGVTLELLNKTGEKLYAGESVWIEFRTSPSSGYIAMRNGEADPLGGGGGFTVNNAAVLTEGQAASYLSEQEVINVDVNNMNRAVYGAPRNKIIVQGNLCVPYQSENSSEFWVKDNITAEMDLNIPEIEDITLSTEETVKNKYHYFTRLKATYYNNTSTYPHNRQWEFNSYYSINGEGAISANSSTASPTYRKAIPFNVGYIFEYSEIVDTSYPAAPYGYITARIVKLAFDSANNIISSISYNKPNYAIVTLPYRSIPFETQAELDYALNVTQRAEIAPSVTEGE